MTTIATITKPGAQTSLQDAGRSGLRHLGIAQSGAADRVSFALANAAVGNPWDTPALECASTGPTLEFTTPTQFALGGAEMSATLNDSPVGLYHQHEARVGDMLQLSAARRGLRAYIAVAGGLNGKRDFGSVSAYPPAGLGGLIDNNNITGAQMPTTQPVVLPDAAPIFAHDVFLRVVDGPETGLFDPRVQQQFLTGPFIAGRRGNRMGVALSGPAAKPPAEFSMASSPVFPGTVQCPPSGEPFLLLADAQTVGGYARMAQVIDADLHLTGQVCPGDRVWFNRVTSAEAREITMQRTSFLSAWLPGFRFC